MWHDLVTQLTLPSLSLLRLLIATDDIFTINTNRERAGVRALLPHPRPHVPRPQRGGQVRGQHRVGQPAQVTDRLFG